MDKIKIERTWLQGSPVQVDNLMGNAFVGEAGAHEFLISGKDNAGNVVPITGTITGKFLSSTMTTFALSGYVTEGVASVTLPSECYGAPGQFVVSIFATNGSTTTCIYCGVGSIFRTSTAAIAYPTTTLPDLTLLINQLDDVIASFPADLTHLLGAIAPTFVDNLPFYAGQYVWYNQVLYRFTADHPAGSWAGSADTVVAVIGTELNSTVRYTQQVLTDAQKTVARTNIDAADADDVTDLELTTVQVTPQTFDDNSKTQARSNIGAASSGDLTALSTIVNNQGGYIGDISEKIGNVPTGETVEGQITDLKSALGTQGNIITGMIPSLEKRDFEIPATAGSYTQCVFNTRQAGTYVIEITTNDLYKPVAIDIYSQSNTLLKRIAKNPTISQETPLIVIFTSAVAFNRMRVHRPLSDANAVTLTYKIYDASVVLTAVNESIATVSNVADFTVNIASDITWLDGYRVYRQNPNFPQANSDYKIANIGGIKKGDLIIVKYPSGHALANSYCSLSERIAYGTDSLQYGFRELILKNEEINKYVAEKDMNITVCGQNGYLPTVEIYRSDTYAKTVDMNKYEFIHFPYNDIWKKLSIAATDRNGQYTDPKPLTLLHYSDVHNSYRNVENVKEFMNRFGAVIDDAICTGDMTGQNFYQYRPIYALEGYKNILLCIGNHDVYDADGSHNSDNEAYWATPAQKYATYIAPSVSEWNVTQPTGAEANGYCYYYKDYNSLYRLIVLDAMAFDDTQYNWLVATLADAKTNNLTVVIADHFAPITSYNGINGFDTPFMSPMNGMEFNYEVSRLTTSNNNNACNAVDEFINGGGSFACWLCGHMHYDQVGTTVNHPNQIFIAIGSANFGTVWEDMPRNKYAESVDLFNIVSIDPRLKLIKVQRIGATIDDWGKVRDHMTINYQTRTLVASS